MRHKLDAIVLNVRKHNDKFDVVTVFDREKGRLALLSPVSGGKTGKMRQARLQPLAVIEADISFRPNSELQKLGSFSLSKVWKTLWFHPLKSLQALFLSEFLNKLLLASMPDPNLSDYIINSIEYLDNLEDGFSDFHIVFLTSLLPFAGIQPDYAQYKTGYCLDMRAGSFVDVVPAHGDFLSSRESAFAVFLLRLDFFKMRILRNNKIRFDRHQTLQTILRYYGIHYPGLASLKSLDVIHSLFQ